MDTKYPDATIFCWERDGIPYQLLAAVDSYSRIKNVAFRIGEKEEVFEPDDPEHNRWFEKEDRHFFYFWDISELEPGEYRAKLTVLDTEGHVDSDAWWGEKGKDGIWRNVK